jgi:hypothetical protein
MADRNPVFEAALLAEFASSLPSASPGIGSGQPVVVIRSDEA